MNISCIQRNSIFYKKRNFFNLGRTSQSKDILLHFRRNCLVSKIEFKLDEKKLFEAEKNKISLHDYLSKISRERRRIKESKHLLLFTNDDHGDDDGDVNIIDHKTNCKKNQTKRGMELLRRKKKKKEAKRKQKRRKYNFLSEDVPRYHKKNEHFDDYDIKTITKWYDCLRVKIKRIFAFNSIDLLMLLRLLSEVICSEYNSSSALSFVDELNVLRHFNSNKIQSTFKGNPGKRKETYLVNKQHVNPQRLIQQKDLLRELNQKEIKFKQSFLNSGRVIEEIKEAQLDQHRTTNSNSNEHLKAGAQNTRKGDNKNNMNEIPLDNKEKNKIKERVINYTLQTDTVFTLKRVVEFWISNCDKLIDKKAKKVKDKPAIYDDHDNDDHKPEKVINKWKKKEVIEHIYSTPSEEILNIIPFCSKKYTILTKNSSK